MKLTGLFLLVLCAVACDPYGFGYKKNPAFVLDEAFKAITNLDVDTFSEVSGKEALCVYASREGVQFLKEKMEFDLTRIKFTPKVLESRHFSAPIYVSSYWSYYQERYNIEVSDKVTGEVLVEAIIDCDYGNDGAKSEKLINLKPSRYRIKECRAIKLVPRKFKPMPLPSQCAPLAITL